MISLISDGSEGRIGIPSDITGTLGAVKAKWHIVLHERTSEPCFYYVDAYLLLDGCDSLSDAVVEVFDGKMFLKRGDLRIYDNFDHLRGTTVLTART